MAHGVHHALTLTPIWQSLCTKTYMLRHVQYIIFLDMYYTVCSFIHNVYQYTNMQLQTSVSIGKVGDCYT